MHEVKAENMDVLPRHRAGQLRDGQADRVDTWEYGVMKMFFWVASELILFILFVPLALAILAITAIESRLPKKDWYA